MVIALLSAGMLSVAGIITSFDTIRWWADRDEFQEIQSQILEVVEKSATKVEQSRLQSQIEQVAGRTCKMELELRYNERRDIKGRLREAESTGNLKWAEDLRKDLREINVTIKRLERDCGF